MCLSPILIKNKSRMHLGKVDCLAHFHDTTSQYIYVSCGVCPECLRKKQMYIVQRCQLESIDNYLYFATFTYSNEMMRFVDINGFKHNYADVTDFQNMLKRVRKSDFFQEFTDVNRKCLIKYMYVTEYGTKRHRPHFHAIFFIPKRSTDKWFTPLDYESSLFRLFLSEWRRNVGSTRVPVYRRLCEFTQVYRNGRLFRPFDLHFVNPELTNGQECDVSFYVTKYCLKYDKWFDDKRIALYKNCTEEDYHKYMKLLKPRVEYSHNFGLNDSSVKYLRECIDVHSSGSPYPVFRNPLTGRLSPMSPYLFNKVGTLVDKYQFYYKSSNPDSDVDSFHYSRIDYNEYINRRDKYISQNNLIFSDD